MYYITKIASEIQNQAVANCAVLEIYALFGGPCGHTVMPLRLYNDLDIT